MYLTWNQFDSKHFYNLIILRNVLLLTCSIPYLLFLFVDLWIIISNINININIEHFSGVRPDAV
jgi:hypothetical protein